MFYPLWVHVVDILNYIPKGDLSLIQQPLPLFILRFRVFQLICLFSCLLLRLLFLHGYSVLLSLCLLVLSKFLEYKCVKSKASCGINRFLTLFLKLQSLSHANTLWKNIEMLRPSIYWISRNLFCWIY